MDLSPEKKKRAKELLFQLMKENNTYDDLSNRVYEAVKHTIMSSSGVQPLQYQSPQAKAYCQLQNNDIVTGFVIDFINTLQIQSTKQALIQDLPDALFYDRGSLIDMFHLQDNQGQPLLLQLFQVIPSEKTSSQQLQMISTTTINTTIEDRYEENNSNDLLNQIVSVVYSTNKILLNFHFSILHFHFHT